MVIGAGIAGVCVAERLAVRGWQVRILERRAGFARAGSGAPAAALHPIIARDDSLPARLTRAGFLHMWRTLAEYPAAKQAAWLGRCGHLLCARTDAAEALAPAIVQDLGFPRSFVTAIDAGQACDAAGVRTARGGYWFPDAGWIRPAPYCETVLARRPDRVSLGLGQAVARLQRGADGWLAMDEQGRVLARSSVVVVAAGTDLSALADLSPAQGGCAEHHRGAGSIPLPLRRVRGQLTSVPARACQPPRVIVGGDGCCLPAVDGRMWFGATYDPDEPDERPRAQDDDRNLQRLAHLLPDNDLHALHPLCSGHVGFRAVAPDRLPLAGALPDVASPSAAAAGAHGVHPVELPRVRGVFMSGGMVASLIEGEPPPIEADLLDAVDPGRFLVKLLRNAKRY
jgi:tRNA 5-methylaminomethyl-2-thiouridine biosynthesis bifunctional protein